MEDTFDMLPSVGITVELEMYGGECSAGKVLHCSSSTIVIEPYNHNRFEAIVHRVKDIKSIGILKDECNGKEE